MQGGGPGSGDQWVAGVGIGCGGGDLDAVGDGARRPGQGCSLFDVPAFGDERRSQSDFLAAARLVHEGRRAVSRRRPAGSSRVRRGSGPSCPFDFDGHPADPRHPRQWLDVLRVVGHQFVDVGAAGAVGQLPAARAVVPQPCGIATVPGTMSSVRVAGRRSCRTVSAPKSRRRRRYRAARRRRCGSAPSVRARRASVARRVVHPGVLGSGVPHPDQPADIPAVRRVD